MNDSPFRQWIPKYRCADCGSEVGFRSRRRTWTEHLIFFMKPVRCGECFRRDYRLLLTPVLDRLSDRPRIMPGKPPAASNRNVA